MSSARVDVYGDPIPTFARFRLGTVRWRHPSLSVEDLTFSRDGQTLYSTGSGAVAFDVATGRRRWTLADPGVSFADALHTPDGECLVAVGVGGALTRIDAGTGATRALAKLPSRYVTAVAVSPDHATVAVGGFDRVGLLLDPDGATRVTLALDEGQYLNSMRFSPDGARLVTTDCAARATLWSVADGRRVRAFDDESPAPNDAVFTPDGARVAVATSNGHIAVYDAATGARSHRWKAHDASASSLAVTLDGARLISVGEDSALSLWDLATGERLATRALPRAWTALALSPDGATAAASSGPRVVLVDVARWVEHDAPDEHGTPVQAAVFSADGRYAATLEADREARVWSLASGRCEARVPIGPVWSLSPRVEADQYALMPPTDAGTQVLDVARRSVTTLATTWSGTHRVWWGHRAEATLFQAKLTLTNAAGVGHTQKAVVTEVLFTPDGRHAVFITGSKVVVWAMDTHTQAGVATVRSARVLVMSPRGDEVLVAGTGHVHRIGVPDGVERGKWKTPPQRSALALAWSPDGSRAALALSDSILIVSHPDGRELARLAGHDAIPSTVRFSPDGRALLSASWDSTAIVWDVDEALAASPAPPAKPAKKKSR